MKLRDLEKLEGFSYDDRPVLMRLDFNVPMKNGVITSDARIRAALPTLEYVLKRGGRVAVMSHLGRPDGRMSPEFSLEPVGAKLSELLKRDVVLADSCIGDGVKALARDVRPGTVLLLENLRFHAGEEANDREFARALAAPFDGSITGQPGVYINDAFGVSHRAHASVSAVTERFRDKTIGFLMRRELEALGQLIEKPKKPFVAIVGGAKVADKIGVLGALFPRMDTLCIGGAMAYTFLKAQGVSIGASRCEDNKLELVKGLLSRAKAQGVKVILPRDHIVATTFDESAAPQVLPDVAIPAGYMGLDIGPKTRSDIAEAVASAQTVFWNGPMGVFEWENFSAGTMAVARALADCAGTTVVGGGDSVAAVEKAGVEDRIGHVSTGGGASLEFLEEGSLVGLEVLGKGD